MKKKSIFKMMALSLLFGSISLGFVACNSDDDDNGENSGMIDRSPAEAIDLGLPSGTLWASCNVGATKPEEYGDYFAWGETTPKENYSWETYKWCDGSSENLTKYNLNDNKTELDLVDDAAYMNWGGRWRMPSLDQINELINNCNWEWTKFNGISGRKVTGPNGNSIFFPAAGKRDENGILYDLGSDGYYWSNKRYSSRRPSCAYCMNFTNWRVFVDEYVRDCGRSVRPVRMK